MTKINDWIYAWKVCKKYGIKWNPFYNLGNAHFTCTVKGENAIIKINPFYRNFKGTFMHEVGHVLFWRKRGQRFYYCIEICGQEAMYKRLECRGRSFIGLLEEEALASRFSAKAVKTKGNKDYLIKAFYTYTSCFYYHLNKIGKDGQDVVKTTDVVYSCIRRIEK